MPDTPGPDTARRPRVGLFVTCLVDLYRPSVGFAAIRLLEQAGCLVDVPRAQTCCGQPAYNTGDRATARDLATGILDAFGGYDYVIAPSGWTPTAAGSGRLSAPDAHAPLPEEQDALSPTNPFRNAPLLAWLLSDRSQHVTGQVFGVLAARDLDQVFAGV